MVEAGHGFMLEVIYFKSQTIHLSKKDLQYIHHHMGQQYLLSWLIWDIHTSVFSS